MFKKLFNSFVIAFLISLALTPKAFAIRSVGNGGGLAEMRVIYLFQNLNRFLQICLTEEKACPVSSATRLEWQSAATSFEDFEVSFVTEALNDQGYTLNGLKMQISHQALYADLKTPNSFDELLAFVISVKQDLQGSKYSFKENIQIAKNVFKNLKIEESSSKVVGLPVILNLSQLKVFDGISDHLIIGLEDEKKTINLSDVITKALPCGRLSQWSFNQWSSTVVAHTAYFYGNALANCSGQPVERKLMIKAGLDSQWLIDESSLTVGFFAN